MLDSNTLLKAMNGDKDAQASLVNTYVNLELEQTQKLLKKMNSDLKRTGKTGMRQVRIIPEFKDALLTFDFMQILNSYIENKVQKERDRAWKYLYNVEEAEKHGYFDEADFKEGGKYWDNEKNKASMKIPKPNEQMLLKWGDNAYANLAIEFWEAEVDVMLLKAQLKILEGLEDE